MSSSHLFFGLPTALHALARMLNSILLFFFVHLVSRCEAVLIANLHFTFLCVSIQQGTLAAFIFLQLLPRVFSKKNRSILLLLLQFLPCLCLRQCRTLMKLHCLCRNLCSSCNLFPSLLRNLDDCLDLQCLLLVQWLLVTHRLFFFRAFLQSFLVLSLSLNNEVKHLALRQLDHSFTFS